MTSKAVNYMSMSTVMILVAFVVQAHSQDAAKLLLAVRDLVVGNNIPKLPSRLYRLCTPSQRLEDEWILISETLSDAGGLIRFPITASVFTRGIYRAEMLTEDYYASLYLTPFYPYVEVVFEKTTDENDDYTIPLLVSPKGYTAYKGSSS